MKANNAILDILEDYLSDRQSKQGIVTANYKKRLKDLDRTEEEVNDLLLAFDDEWTIRQLYDLRLRRSFIKLYGGLGITIGFTLITVLSYFGLLFQGRLFIFAYGPIAVGVVASIFGYNQIKIIEDQQKKSTAKWQRGY